MLFNSTEFLVFFPIVVTLFVFCPRRFRWVLFLSASAIFYSAFIPAYLLIFVAIILIDYVAGLFIERTRGRTRLGLLLLSIASNVGILVFFKYFNFFAENLTDLAQFLHWNYSVDTLAIILPLGLSFHTFQAMSYTIEVYRGKQQAERHLGIYALYVMFFPQLVAGPIERPQNMLPQYHAMRGFEYGRAVSGIRLMLVGFFKKVVIADQAAVMVNLVYGNPEAYTGTALMLATVLFAFQIYGDFSGYSDIAIGSARVLGFDLMTNFNHPYLAISVPDFWRRWHISLTSWFRDYIYIPLGGNRVPKWKWCRNILIIFLLSGFWHGANWTFILWGLLHGFYVLGSAATAKVRAALLSLSGLIRHPRLHAALATAVTFALVTFAWIFFRANSLHEAWYIAAHLMSGVPDMLLHPSLLIHSLPDFNKRDLIAVFLSLAILGAFPRFVTFFSARTLLGKNLSSVPYGALVVWVLVFGAFISEQFIYFQF